LSGIASTTLTFVPSVIAVTRACEFDRSCERAATIHNRRLLTFVFNVTRAPAPNSIQVRLYPCAYRSPRVPLATGNKCAGARCLRCNGAGDRRESLMCLGGRLGRPSHACRTSARSVSNAPRLHAHRHRRTCMHSTRLWRREECPKHSRNGCTARRRAQNAVASKAKRA